MRYYLLLVCIVKIFADPIPQQELTDANFASGINRFGADFVRQTEYKDKNVLFSPLGLSMVAGMIIQASNDSSENIYKMLHMDELSGRDKFHSKMNHLIKEYKEMHTRGEDKRNVTIELANLVLYADSLDLNQHFKDSLQSNYEADVEKENFATNGPEIMEKVNKFVKERTHELIPSILTSPMEPSTLMAIINTVYFKGFWLGYFDTTLTENKTFTNIDQTEKMVPMMHKANAFLNYHHSDKHKVSFLELPYDGEASMIIALPDEKQGLTKLIENWDMKEMKEIIESMKHAKVSVTLPKFEFDSSVKLIDAFANLGVDLGNSLTSLDPSIKVSEAIHKAKIRVHESGTEAAAVTILHITRVLVVSDPEEPIVFNADHPFCFAIKDKKSGIVLFSGVLNKIE